MKIRLLRTKVLNNLQSEIVNNLDRYRMGTFDFLSEDSANYFEIDSEVDEAKLALVDVSATDHEEISCCMRIHEAMGSIAPYLARDPRLWVYLTHSCLLEYSRKRWPIPKDNEKAISHIQKHFFANGTRGIERDNAASRLWWMAALCSRVSGMTLQESLTCFLHQYDVRANIIERPTTSQSIPIFSAVIKKLDESYKGNQRLFDRETFRSVMKELNLLGGVKLLSALDDNDIHTVVDNCMK